MIAGTVTADLVPVIRATVNGPNSSREIEAALDTGFTGHLTLRPHIINALQLPSLGVRRASLADGRSVFLAAHAARLTLATGVRPIVVLASETGALLGMSALYGHRLTIDVVAVGGVTIEPLP